MRELREFRVHHEEFTRAGIGVAGITLDAVDSTRAWGGKLDIPYPLLSDESRDAGRAFRVLRELGLGGWKFEMFRRTTFLADRDGVVRAVWGDVKIRGHAGEVLARARRLPGG